MKANYIYAFHSNRVSLSEITMKFWTRFLTLQALTAITYHGPCQILCFRDGRCFVIKENFLSASAQDILRQNDIPFVIQKTLRCDSNKSLPFMHTWYHFSFFAYLNKFSPVTFSTLLLNTGHFFFSVRYELSIDSKTV